MENNEGPLCTAARKVEIIFASNHILECPEYVEIRSRRFPRYKGDLKIHRQESISQSCLKTNRHTIIHNTHT